MYLSEIIYTANFYPMKTTGTGNCGVPAGKTYRSCNYHGVSSQFLQPFSIDSADFLCRDPAIPSPRSFHGIKICSVLKRVFLLKIYLTKNMTRLSRQLEPFYPLPASRFFIDICRNKSKDYESSPL